MKKSRFLLSVLLVACLVMAIGMPAYAAKVIKIGVIGPMNFMQGKGHWNGAIMAQEEINAKGGIQVGTNEILKFWLSFHFTCPGTEPLFHNGDAYPPARTQRILPSCRKARC